MRPQQDGVRYALVPLALEVMLRHPQRVEAEFVHKLGYLAGGLQALYEPVVGVASAVGGRAVGAHVIEVYVSDVEYGEVLYHRSAYISLFGFRRRLPRAPRLSHNPRPCDKIPTPHGTSIFLSRHTVSPRKTTHTSAAPTTAAGNSITRSSSAPSPSGSSPGMMASV